jgi:hypothetical protein
MWNVFYSRLSRFKYFGNTVPACVAWPKHLTVIHKLPACVGWTKHLTVIHTLPACAGWTKHLTVIDKLPACVGWTKHLTVISYLLVLDERSIWLCFLANGKLQMSAVFGFYITFSNMFFFCFMYQQFLISVHPENFCDFCKKNTFLFLSKSLRKTSCFVASRLLLCGSCL